MNATGIRIAHGFVLLLLSMLPATAQNARQSFLDAEGRPLSHGRLTVMRLGASRTIKLDKNGMASVQLDWRDSYLAIRDSKGRPVATYSVIWTGSNYRLNALSCFGWSCSLDQKTNLFPVRKP